MMQSFYTSSHPRRAHCFLLGSLLARLIRALLLRCACARTTLELRIALH
jgi:hypothetical protein